MFFYFVILGSQILLEKLQKYKPKIAVFNGKLIYEVFSGNKDFHFGRQPDFVDGTNTVSILLMFNFKRKTMKNSIASVALVHSIRRQCCGYCRFQRN